MYKHSKIKINKKQSNSLIGQKKKVKVTSIAIIALRVDYFKPIRTTQRLLMDWDNVFKLISNRAWRRELITPGTRQILKRKMS